MMLTSMFFKRCLRWLVPVLLVAWFIPGGFTPTPAQAIPVPDDFFSVISYPPGCDPGMPICGIKPGETLQVRVNFPTCDARCGTETWYLDTQNHEPLPAEVTATFDPPVTSGNQATTLTLRAAPDAPNYVNFIYLRAKSSAPADQVYLGPMGFFFSVIRPSSLEIVATPGGVVSDKTQTTVIGKHMNLEVRDKEGRDLSNIHWTVPGTVIKDYRMTASAARPEELTPADLTGSTVSFYWIGEDTNTVRVSATAPPGVRLETTATFGVLGPTDIGMKAKMDDVHVGPAGPPYTFPYGMTFGTTQTSPLTPGIDWLFSARAPSGGAGQLATVQLVNVSRTATCNNGRIQQQTSGGAYVLDLPEQQPGQPPRQNPSPLYLDIIDPIAANAPGTWASSDSPGTALEKVPPSGPFTVKESDHDSFEDFFVYRPAEADSIWVTIGLMKWSWSGETSRNQPYTPGSDSWSPPVAGRHPAYWSDSHLMPSWDATGDSISWNPATC